MGRGLVSIVYAVVCSAYLPAGADTFAVCCPILVPDGGWNSYVCDFAFARSRFVVWILGHAVDAGGPHVVGLDGIPFLVSVKMLLFV